MRTDAPQLVVRGVDAGVRPVRLAHPFRFGAVTLQACPQLFVRARVDVDGRAADGYAAEMMVPKWFDKRPGFNHADNVAALAHSLERAADAYRDDVPATAFGLFERHYSALIEQPGATALTAAYGQAVLDRAVLDALCRALGVSFFDAAAANAFGLAAGRLTPDLSGFDCDALLAALLPLRRIAVRHTVGLLDDAAALPRDLRWFKIKLGGDVDADRERLRVLLPGLPAGSRYTLDGNEQYADAAPLFEMLRALPHPLPAYIEQPTARDAVAVADDPPAPLLLDEGDGTLDAFPRAYAAGWSGVSSKSCKGLYKSLLNRARCARWSDDARRDGLPPRAFMSAEDLTCQAGLSVQQDLALASLLGLTHAERNGHHYHPGFGSAPAAEQRAFAAAHADLYVDRHAGGPPRLRIADGGLDLGSLFAPGFAHRADPDWSSLRPLADATSML